MFFKRKLFCEISPFTYFLSVKKERLKRRVKDLLSGEKFARSKSEPLPVLIYSHNSLIRRKLGNVDIKLQENKAVNLAIAAPKVDRILIKPGETFSFWCLVGSCTKRKGYKEGLVLSNNKTSADTGGGMCQFTNLLHFMVLHSPLDITECHHHNNFDLFPDFGRQVPFGVGTSIMYNYLDYRVMNNTENTFQFIVYTNETRLCGELRAEQPALFNYSVNEEENYFIQIGEKFFRRNKVYRSRIDKETGAVLEKVLISEANAEVLYDSKFIQAELIRNSQVS